MDKCEDGSADGGSEKLLPHLYTSQQCIDAVRKQYRRANGFTMDFPCDWPKKCNCWAVFDMTGWNSDQKLWKTCRFHTGKYIIQFRCGRVVTDFLPYPKFSKSSLS